MERVSALKVGDPLDEASDMGSIINAKQYESVLGYIENGKAQAGVDVALDGTTMDFAGLDGFYTGPTVWSGGRELLAGGPGGDLRAGAGGHPLAGPGRGDPIDGQPFTRTTVWVPTSGRTT